MARLQGDSDTKSGIMPSSAMPETKRNRTAPRQARPTDATLHEAALAYLARYAASRAGVIRVLDRRVARWARLSPEAGEEAIAECRAMVRRVATRLEQAGLIDDARFAAQRARSLARSGKSRRAVAAHLGARGIGGDTLAGALPADEAEEFAACLILARKRRIGPFRPDGKPADRMRELGVLARAGFAQGVAQRALAIAPDEAEALIVSLRQD
jgi:regulatory protein